MKEEQQRADIAGDWVRSAGEIYTAVVLDALDGLGHKQQSPRVPMPAQTVEKTIVGPAKTLLWLDFAYHDPNTYELELAAIDSVVDGDVIVCATARSDRSGIWGELLTTAAKSRGAAGIITDGAVRDVRRVAEMDFPVYARGRSPYDSFDRQKVVQFDVDVELGGVSVRPGDIVVADGDGVAIVPIAVAPEVLAAALAKVREENAFRVAVKGGMPLVEAYQKFQVL